MLQRLCEGPGWVAVLAGGLVLGGCGQSSSNGAGRGMEPAAGSSGTGAGVGGQISGAGAGGVAPNGGTAAIGGRSGGAGMQGAAGGGAAGGAASAGAGGNSGVAGGAGAGGNAGSCDDIACPDLGTCTVEARGDGCLRTCAFDLTLTSADEVARLAALKCEVIDGALRVTDYVASLAGLETVREITGGLSVGPGALENLYGLEGLETLGNCSFLQAGQLTSIDLPALRNVTGPLQLIALGSLQTIVAPRLETVGNDLRIVSCESLVDVQMGSLATVGGAFLIGLNGELMTVNELPSLVSVQGDFTFNGNPRLPQCEVDAIVEQVGRPCTCSGSDLTASCP